MDRENIKKGGICVDHIKVLGYYREREEKGNKEELLYFLAYVNSYNQNDESRQKGIDWVEGYNVIDGHFQLYEGSYLNECDEVTKEDYLEGTKGYKTPELYL